MKNKVLLMILMAILLIVLIKIVVDLNSPSGSVQIAAGKINNNITYRILNDYKEESFDYSKRGYYVDTYFEPNAPWFYIISMGSQSTGGFSIEISEVKIDKNGNVEVTVKENKPLENETVTMAFTTPTVCLKLSKKPNSIKIINTEGKIFEELNGN